MHGGAGSQGTPGLERGRKRQAEPQGPSQGSQGTGITGFHGISISPLKALQILLREEAGQKNLNVGGNYGSRARQIIRQIVTADNTQVQALSHRCRWFHKGDNGSSLKFKTRSHALVSNRDWQTMDVCAHTHTWTPSPRCMRIYSAASLRMSSMISFQLIT